MQKASRLLETSPAGVAEVAKRIDYDAEAAVSKAFKRWIGVAPGAYRRTAGARGEPGKGSSRRRSWRSTRRWITVLTARWLVARNHPAVLDTSNFGRRFP